MRHRTTLLAGSIDIGEVGIRAVGLLWLLAGLSFAVSSLGVILRAPWSLPLTAIVTVGSVLLCVAGWPDSWIGVFVNSEQPYEIGSHLTSIAVCTLPLVEFPQAIQVSLPVCKSRG